MKAPLLILAALATLAVPLLADTVGEPPTLNPVGVAGVNQEGEVTRFHFNGTALEVITADTAEQLTPTLTVATSSGSISAGARFVSIALSDDFAGTILGTAVTPADLASLTIAAPTGSTLAAITYTRSAGKLIILTLRPSE